MPSVSKKQHNFMEAIAHSPSFAKKAGVPQSVGKDFASADKGKTFKGSDMKKMAKGGSVAPSKMGAVPIGKTTDGVVTKGKTKGTVIKMAGSKGMKSGGMTKMKMGGKAC